MIKKFNLTTNYSFGHLQNPIILSLTFCMKVLDVLIFSYFILHTRQHYFISIPVTE